MAHYIIEIEDEPILVFIADDVDKALELADSDAMADDLTLFRHDGTPIWNGQSDLIVREAHAIDAATWEKAFTDAVQHGGADLDDRNRFVVFLKPVTDSSDDESEEAGELDNRH